MKPHELFAAFMHQAGGSLALAKLVKNKKAQPQYSRFANGRVTQPNPSTVAPVADHFKVPLSAFYDEKVATQIATERGIQPAPRKERREPTRAADLTKLLEARLNPKEMALLTEVLSSDAALFVTNLNKVREGSVIPGIAERAMMQSLERDIPNPQRRAGDDGSAGATDIGAARSTTGKDRRNK